MLIHTKDDAFVDENGRRLLLRGVNLSGASKAPVGQPSQRLEGFWEAAESGMLDFRERPLNLDDGSADLHLERLRGWGYNMLRYPVTWEALEHEGPGKYDEDFMDYTIRVLQRCKAYGFKVFIDPHQDIWSRYSGGSGAPYWTLLACGMNPRHFSKTRSALLHAEWSDPEEFPAMIWSTNYTRLASQTLYTLFFGGKKYARNCIIDGVNIQDYLQSHFIEAYGKLADRIRDTAPELFDDCIIGWDTVNEPSEGFIGWMDLEEYPTGFTNALWKGTRPTPAQSLRLGMGIKQEVEVWDFGSFGPKKTGEELVDPEGVTIWADRAFLGESEDGTSVKYGWKRSASWVLGTCIWALHGVWDPESGDIRKARYFAVRQRHIPDANDTNDLAYKEVGFTAAHWQPHAVAYMKRIYQAHPNAIAFLQPPVFVAPPGNMDCEKNFNGRVCYSPHYYDGITLITRHWHWYNADALGLMRGKYKSKLAAIKIGEGDIRKSFREQLGMYKEDARTKLGPYPTLIGEIGIPFDMDNRRAYGYTDGGKYTGDYSSQIKALDASLFGADGEDAISYTVWNYCPDNTHRWGDQWNREDLSIWSPDDVNIVPPTMDRPRRLQKKTSLPTSIARPENDYPPTSTAVHSRAALINSTYPSELNLPSAPGAAASALSLNTLDIHSTPISRTASHSQLRFATLPEAPREQNAYAFLTSGARATKAFCRPWPVATTGRITAFDFDLGKAEMKMTISVSASSASPAREEPGKPGRKEWMTDIYVPLVHFASDQVVLETLFPSEDSQARKEPRSESPSPVVTRPLAASFRSANSASSTSVSSGAPTIVHQYPFSTPFKYSIEQSDFGLEVTMSTGRYELQGQYLRWFYTIPEKGEPDAEYTIKIKRIGGSISKRSLLTVMRNRATDGRSLREGDLQDAGCISALCQWIANILCCASR